MTRTTETSGRERRRQERFVLQKAIGLLWDGRRHAGNLRDISIGGAAVKIRADVAPDAAVILEMGDFGTIEAIVLRRIEPDIIAVQFRIDEARAAELGRKLMAVFQGQTASDKDPNKIEKTPLAP